ncbi:CACTA en-spm transposon protein [Cucumis melo var. makuwa]|uniref:CACTA en-spm transposon protein n=1 Tax=Cucumis melo var. makuwa TaxID=1194695 RepID=A0A5A7U5F3_CUCMM|nr:CACTA en-spm transposon protein [Cucumis melo var. makuwa]TYK15927.1 CACTA en-spm transposon protein [Cucumis melo var. makuwa]
MSTSTMSSFSSDFEEIDMMFLEFDKDLNNTTEGSSSVGDNLVKTTQPSPTPMRHAQSLLLEFERYVHANGWIPMSIAPRRRSPFRHTLFSSAKPLACHFFMLDFNDQAMNRSNHRRTSLLDKSSLTIMATGLSHFYNDNTTSLSNEVLSHSLRTRYVRLVWVDDRANQKVLVGDPSPSLARQPMLAVPRPHVCNPQWSSNYGSSLMKLNKHLKNKEGHQRC